MQGTGNRTREEREREGILSSPIRANSGSYLGDAGVNQKRGVGGLVY